MRIAARRRTITSVHIGLLFLIVLAGLSSCIRGSSSPTPTVEDLPLATRVPSEGNRVLINFNLDWKYQPGEVEGAQETIFDDSSWTYVDTPHTTKFVTPQDALADLGVSWYRKHFTLDGMYSGSKLFIEFEAVMQVADVWVNGEKVVHHEGGYTPFTIDVSDDVVFGGENVISVRIDNNANPDWAPGKNDIDFQFHGGIYRDVRMIVTDRLHVTDAVFAGEVAGGGVFVTYPLASSESATVDVKTNVFNEYDVAKETTVVSEILEEDGRVVGSASSTATIEADADNTFDQEIVIDKPQLWHPYTPNLYYLRTTVLDAQIPVDGIVTRIGIRRIEWTHDDGLLINGAPFTAVGVNMHQEIYGLGYAVPNQAIYYDVKRIKDGGMNFIRAAHYPHDPAFYDACDELGILVLDAQTGWQNFVDSQVFYDNTLQELRDMIRRDRNHPSVVAWEASLNESHFSREWAQDADRIVHEEFPGEQAYSAAWIYDYHDIFIEASQHDVRRTKDSRPIIIVEYGDWDYGGFESTSRQAREAGDGAMLIQAANVQDGHGKNVVLPWYSADGYWDYADYAGFARFGITRPGLVDMYRIPKFAYYFLQSQRDPQVIFPGVDSGPMVYIANHWTPDSPTTIEVYSNCDEVSLYVNDTLLETRSPDSGTNLVHPPLLFEVDAFTPGTLRAECLIASQQNAVFERSTPGEAVSIRLRPEAQTLLADGSDVRLVLIDILDGNGTVVVTDSSEVTLSITGPGSIVGPSTLRMQGGQLAVWVRSQRTAGTITLSASAPDLGETSVELTSLDVPGLPPLPADRVAQ